MSVADAARRRVEGLVVDEAADTLRWRDDAGAEHLCGLHDYAALYDEPGLYEAVFFDLLGGRSPHLLADALAGVVPELDRALLQVLDVGAGTGVVGEQLASVGFTRLAATDLEPASERAVRRDRPHVYTDARTLDLCAPTEDDTAWLAALDAQVVTVAGAVGFGHLPVAALAAVTDLLRAGGLLAVTVARDLEDEPELREHAALLLGPAYAVKARVAGLHRLTTAGDRLEVDALVLERR